MIMRKAARASDRSELPCYAQLPHAASHLANLIASALAPPRTYTMRLAKSKSCGPTVEQPRELRPQRHDDHEIDDVVNCTVASVSRSNSSCGARAECESGAASETQMAAATSGEID
jgi:hypothetical protein